MKLVPDTLVDMEHKVHLLAVGGPTQFATGASIQIAVAFVVVFKP